MGSEAGAVAGPRMEGIPAYRRSMLHAGCLPPPQAPWAKGHGQIGKRKRGHVGEVAAWVVLQGENEGNRPLASQLNFLPTSLSLRGGGWVEVGDSILWGWWWKEDRRGRPHPLSQGAAPVAPASPPCCPGCRARARPSSDLGPRWSRWVSAGHSRTSPSGHWVGQEKAGQLWKGAGWLSPS